MRTTGEEKHTDNVEAVSTFETKAAVWVFSYHSDPTDEENQIFLIPWAQDREYNPDAFNL